MKLKALLKGVKAVIKGSKDVEINGISADSRTIAPGNVFIARKGSVVNGADFIAKAIEAGASAIVTDLFDPFLKVPQVIVDKPERLESLLAARIFGEPSKELFVVGVTGTKGKTTTSYMVHHLLIEMMGPSGLASGVETIAGDERRSATLTTHSAIYNQRLLKEMVARGCKSAAFEVSSHGLDQGRVDEIEFDLGIFTNLYTDHMDYHPTMEDYAKAKSLLFSKPLKRSIVNGDSPWVEKIRGEGPTWTFGIDLIADIRASEISFTAEGSSFVVEFDGQRQIFQMSLMGKFNVYNALGMIGVGLHLGASLHQISEILKTFKTAPGRLERVENKKKSWVFVDHSHSGPALENVLTELRKIAQKRLICVFGCGGNRDPLRRSQMARAAENLADIAIVTSDNPRKENPEAICEEILSSFSDRTKPILMIQRKEAIYKAIEMAGEGDIVLIAGKGHEKVQIFAHETVPFDDVAIAYEAGNL